MVDGIARDIIDAVVRVRAELGVGLLESVEAKASHELHPTAFAQTLTYLTATRSPLGLLVNFHAVPLRTGIHRLIDRRPE